MNLFLRELRAHRKSLLFWCIGMMFLVFTSMVKYANLQASGQSISGLLDQFPHAVKVIFGINGFDLSSISGYYGVMYLYIALAATIHALLLGTEIITKEERDKTAEFLFVKPLSRAKIITTKLSAGVSNVLIVTLVTLVTSVVTVRYYNTGESITNDILLLMGGLLFLQLIFFFVGFTTAAVSKKPKQAASLATAALLITFILPFVVALNDRLTILSFLSPFEYFDAKSILANGNLSIGYVVVSIALICTLTATTYVAYRNRDLTV
jgi:ABC-2 type transport system permease protein